MEEDKQQATTPAVRYTCLKPNHGTCSFYIYMTLNDKQKQLTIYYQKVFYKRPPKVEFEKFFHDYTKHKNLVTVSGGKSGTKKCRSFKRSPNKLRIKGKCFLHRQILKDIFGFFEPSTHRILHAKIDITVNSTTKLVDVKLLIPYKSLGKWPEAIKRLEVFGNQVDAEYVKTHLKFFTTSYLAQNQQTPTRNTNSCETSVSDRVQTNEVTPEFTADEKFNGNAHPYTSILKPTAS